MNIEVYKSINRVQATLSKTGITKDRDAKQGGATVYKFRGIDDVYNTLSPLLAENNLVIIPRMISREVNERTTAKGATLFYVTLEAEFDFVSSIDGSKHTARTFGEAMDSGDKATNKAMSIAYKYACFQTFAIPTEGDNDPDAVVHEDILPSLTNEEMNLIVEDMIKAETEEELKAIFGDAWKRGDKGQQARAKTVYENQKRRLGIS